MAADNSLNLSVSTWNTLADNYSSSKSFPYCDKQFLLWNSHRRDLIFSKLDALNSDIYLLQEVDKINDYKTYFQNNNYHVSFCKRTNHKLDGCLIAFKSNLFQLITPIYITNYNYLCKLCDEFDEYTKASFSKDNIGMIAALKHKQFPNSIIIIGNTHLHWDPNLPHTKLWQTASFLNSIQWIITKHKFKQYNIIIGGDFNSMPTSDVYKFITNGYINITHKLKLSYESNISNENHPLKLILFGNHLKKLYPWLIWSGIDVICVLHTDYIKLFAIATQQQRIIITINKKLVQRRNCPKYILLQMGQKREEYFEELTRKFHLDILSQQEYDTNIKNNLLCFQCKQILVKFEKLQDIDINKLNQHELDKYNQSNNTINIELQWQQCPQCYQLSYYRKDGILSVKLQDCIDNFNGQIKKMKERKSKM
eukprot:230361_1